MDTPPLPLREEDDPARITFDLPREREPDLSRAIDTLKYTQERSAFAIHRAARRLQSLEARMAHDEQALERLLDLTNAMADRFVAALQEIDRRLTTLERREK